MSVCQLVSLCPGDVFPPSTPPSPRYAGLQNRSKMQDLRCKIIVNNYYIIECIFGKEKQPGMETTWLFLF